MVRVSGKEIVFIAALTAGCGTTPVATESDASTGPTLGSSTSSMGPSATASSPSTSSSSAETTSSSDSGLPDHVPPGFLDSPDGGTAWSECSVWLEDCPSGEKCMPYANDGGNSWNAMRCSPIAPDPARPGEPCTVQGSGVSGIDDCEQHAMCWDVDRDTLEGTCHAMCIGSEAAPACAEPDHYCTIDASGFTPLCLPTCDPLAQDCGAGRGCYRVDGNYLCAPDASGDGGGLLEPCEYLNACDPGFVCVTTSVCEGQPGCCAPFCSLSAPDCPAGRTCVPALEPGTEPIGLSDVGICGDPA